MPNVFSPNGDGINDYFQPIAHNVSHFYCAVYDRWGKIVFEFQSTQDKWNGQTKNGSACPDGTYYYIVEAKDDNGKPYNTKGFLTMNR
jgi:gliding motility-associated-like protein